MNTFVWIYLILLFCVLRFDIGLADTEADGYSGNVKALFEDLTEYPSHVLIAKEKMNEFKNETWDRKYAIGLINLYTQPGSFYLTLNAEMKNNFTANTDIWKRAGDLTNRAVDILQSIMFPQVYRGCQSFDDLPILGKEYYFKHIITASPSKYTSVSFVHCEDNFLFQIENVYGVSVEKYSHYSQDKEVIIKSTHKFYVFDGLHKEGQYNVYFLSGQASESVFDVLHFIPGSASLDKEADGYSGKVKALFEDLTKYTTQVLIAKDKMNEFKNETWDRKYAIGLMNLYTQPGQFYSNLNSEMAHGYPEVTDVWKRAGNLINRAVDILGPKRFERVYRGCFYLDYLLIEATGYYFPHITTASLSKETAVSYMKCAYGFIFQIENVCGVLVDKYSQYPQDKEVIIKSTHRFDVIDGPHKDGKNNVFYLNGQANESVNSCKENGVIQVIAVVGPVIAGLAITTSALLFLHYKCNLFNRCWNKMLATKPLQFNVFKHF